MLLVDKKMNLQLLQLAELLLLLLLAELLLLRLHL
jgi:hypothetical protein